MQPAKFDPSNPFTDTWRKRLLIGFVFGCLGGFVTGFFSGGILAAVAFSPCQGLLIGGASAFCPKRYFDVLIWIYSRL